MAIGNKFESTVDWTSSKMTESTIGLKKLDEFRMTREKLEAEKEAMDRAKKAEAESQKQCVFVAKDPIDVFSTVRLA